MRWGKVKIESMGEVGPQNSAKFAVLVERVHTLALSFQLTSKEKEDTM